MDPAKNAITLRAYAKINLGLFVYGMRKDGYHDIETIFHLLDLYDELSIDHSDDGLIRFEAAGRPIPEGKSLCVRAAAALKDACEIDRGAAIRLLKRIPIGAGLGGGSSDAAAVLRGLGSLWGVPDEKLVHVAGRIGSDVPYFIRPGTAYGSGRGEILHYLELRLPYWILTAIPPIHVSTAWAYRQVSTRPGKPDGRLLEAALKAEVDVRPFLAFARNDFEAFVSAEHPKIRLALETLWRSGAEYASLSGSGSAVFGLYASKKIAEDAGQLLGGVGPAFEVFLTPPALVNLPART